jgi:hypothetical protein
LSETVAELNSISGDLARIHFLAQLFTEFIQHVESSNVAKLSHRQAKISALQLLLEQASRQHSFPTVICKALYIATKAGNCASAGLTFTSLAQYLTSGNTTCTSKSNLGIIVLCTAICSGWSSVSTDSLVLDLAHRILISSLEEEFDNRGVCSLTPALKDSLLFVLSTSEVSSTSSTIEFQKSHTRRAQLFHRHYSISFFIY